MKTMLGIHASPRKKVSKAPGARAPAVAPPAAACPAVRHILHSPRPQAKLTVGAPNDAFEQEADQVANQVTRMPEPAVQRTCAHCQKEMEGEGVVRRKCSKCEEEELHAKEEPGRTPSVPEGFESRFAALRGGGGGRPLPASERAFFEPRFGRDFSNVRLHSGPAAGELARSVHARAFTLGDSIVLGPGEGGRQLLAHELAHTLQQSRDARGEIRRQETEEAPCATYEPGEVGTSRSAAGHLDPDVTLHAPGELLIADFGVDRHRVKAGTQSEPLLVDWLDTWERDDSYRLKIVGYSDCVGVEDNNIDLRQNRAKRVEKLLPSGARSRVTFRGMAALGDYVDDNGSVAGRARNRGVVIEFQKELELGEQTIEGRSCDAPPSPASSLDEYVFLVQCAEAATGYTPLEMLSLLRQLYYGDMPWSRVQSQYWPQVIPCGLSLADPRVKLGATLFTALRDSNVVAGIDMGHVFTGLESMVCPTTSVELEVPGPNPIVAMPNEEFATWGGDLGSAAAHKTHDEVDLSVIHAWSHYFLTSGSVASSEDLQGDIDAHVLRQSVSGLACPATAGTALPSLSSPISDSLASYYMFPAAPGFTTQQDRFRCFVQSIGGTISGSSITNKAALVTPMRNRVESFARIFYLGLVTVPLFAIGTVETMRLLQYSWEATERFLDWLEANL